MRQTQAPQAVAGLRGHATPGPRTLVRTGVWLAALGAMLALSACGSRGGGAARLSSVHTTGAASASAPATRAPRAAKLPLAVSIPNLTSGNLVAARYTCAGANVSVPVRWSGVPHEAKELVLFVLSLQPVGGRLFADWAVAGLSPSLRGLEAGRLPAGAVVGKNSYGQESYSICPAQGSGEGYEVELTAMPYRQKLRPGFEWRAVYDRAGHDGLAFGLHGMRYERRR